MSAEAYETGESPIENVEGAAPDSADESPPDDDISSGAEGDWPSDEIELAYRQALEAVEAVETEVELQGGFGESSDEADASSDHSGAPTDAVGEAEAIDAQSGPSESGAAHPGVTPRQIIEAALFVGGTPLTIKRIGMLLRNEFDQDFVEQTIDALNSTYTEERRPYEITFGEGGYRMVLRSEFERLRSRAYGFGPKEVKLSQDALEVLALVAYRQPISAAEIEEAGKSNPDSTLRLLVRRELFAIERTGKKRGDVKYRTTPRFLELFGLRDLDELPQSDDDLNFK